MREADKMTNMVKEMVVLGRKISLPIDYSEEEFKNNFISLLKDLAPDIADELGNAVYIIIIEGNRAIINRTGAIFG